MSPFREPSGEPLPEQLSSAETAALGLILPSQRQALDVPEGSRVVVFALVTPTARALKRGTVLSHGAGGQRVSVALDHALSVANVRPSNNGQLGGSRQETFSLGIAEPFLMREPELAILQRYPELAREWSQSGYVSHEQDRHRLLTNLRQVGILETRPPGPLSVDQLYYDNQRARHH